ncbi:craniofacial development protein 2 [Elysia marginata]|uniref:Craniofacial development protein 2 n=1 Tax=Elysia marginata TaxID=1093978 RepID=A0AAV4H085_9GAST|nr:craniofacial development protein 2 [Elysia marginata]
MLFLPPSISNVLQLTITIDGKELKILESFKSNAWEASRPKTVLYTKRLQPALAKQASRWVESGVPNHPLGRSVATTCRTLKSVVTAQRLALRQQRPSNVPSPLDFAVQNRPAILNVYAPHSVLTKKDPKTREDFYNKLSETYKSRKTKGDTVLILGDFNSKVGKIKDEIEKECIGSFSKGQRNDNGQELLNFCLEHDLFIANSAFKHKSCHQTTWQGQIKKDNKIIKVYNQIDFILISKHMKKSLTDARSFAGTLTNSVHRLVRANLDFHIKPFRKYSVGSPQGDGLSPTLFIIYLEAALKEVRASIQINSQKSPSELSYADDVDFIFSQLTEAENNHNIIADTLAKLNLIVNKTKTEFTNISRTSEDWKDTKKLGSLLDTTSDIERRTNLATIAFRKMYTIWIRRNKISEERLLRLYKALILPILLYNSGTWATTKTIFEKLNAFHCKQLSNLLGIKWTDKISNEELYHRTKSQATTVLITRSRWNLFGHILRRSIDIPANLAMKACFDPSNKPGYRGKPP